MVLGDGLMEGTGICGTGNTYVTSDFIRSYTRRLPALGPGHSCYIFGDELGQYLQPMSAVAWIVREATMGGGRGIGEPVRGGLPSAKTAQSGITYLRLIM